ncbi:MAG: purple acid phosphatase family protein, partial [Planctomycetota bacterium]
MLRAALLPLLLWPLLGGVGQPPEGQIVFGPYVNNVDSSSARILWISPAGASPLTVRVRGAGGSLEAEPTTSHLSERQEVVQIAALAGLQAGTRYEYVVGDGPGAVRGSFQTAPQEARPFRFIAYGDTRTNPARHAVVSGAIAREEPAFVLCSGDLVASGENWSDWQAQFFEPAEPFLRQAALWPARGNHEGDAVYYRQLFDLPGNELYYSFDFADAHFVVLDSENEEAQAAMLAWLEDDLARSAARWTFVMYHRPTFNVGGHASTWGQEDVLPLLERHGADFVITGHSHLYERFV